MVEPSLDSRSERTTKTFKAKEKAEGSQQRVGSVLSRFNSSNFSLKGTLHAMYRKTLSILNSESFISTKNPPCLKFFAFKLGT